MILVLCAYSMASYCRTGLDSFSAHSVVKTLTKLSRQGRTIIFTIHQPSSEIFNLFDRSLLLGRGRTIYFGEAVNMLDHFRNVGHDCPSWENPADFVSSFSSLPCRSEPN